MSEAYVPGGRPHSAATTAVHADHGVDSAAAYRAAAVEAERVGPARFDALPYCDPIDASVPGIGNREISGGGLVNLAAWVFGKWSVPTGPESSIG